MVPDPQQLERFRANLDALIGRTDRIGIAVSGGPDSLALLLLAHAAANGRIEAATVDHDLRAESSAEAAMVQAFSEQLGVPHRTLTIAWSEKPQTALQERSRLERYRLLAEWASERQLQALATGHHLDDQAETFVMRLARGAGVRGLAGMRHKARVPGSDLPLIRPLLGWRRSEVEEICRASGVRPVLDPSNEDESFERVRVRKGLRNDPLLDPNAIAASATHLGQAEAALEWATSLEWSQKVENRGSEIVYRPTDAPIEIRRRIIARAVLQLASEGGGAELRGREFETLIDALVEGRGATVRGVLCTGGSSWRFRVAPARRR
jgi:tRNA(Ile)-lysidine synthase